MTHRIVEVATDAGKRDEFVEVARDAWKAAAFPARTDLTLYSVADPGRVAFLQRWESYEAYEGTHGTPAHDAFAAAIVPYIVGDALSLHFTSEAADWPGDSRDGDGPQPFYEIRHIVTRPGGRDAYLRAAEDAGRGATSAAPAHRVVLRCVTEPERLAFVTAWPSVDARERVATAVGSRLSEPGVAGGSVDLYERVAVDFDT